MPAAVDWMSSHGSMPMPQTEPVDAVELDAHHVVKRHQQARHHAGGLPPAGWRASRKCRVPAPGKRPNWRSRRPRPPSTGSWHFCAANMAAITATTSSSDLKMTSRHWVLACGRSSVIDVVRHGPVIVSSRPSAADSAAASAPAATSPEMTYGSWRSRAWASNDHVVGLSRLASCRMPRD